MNTQKSSFVYLVDQPAINLNNCSMIEPHYHLNIWFTLSCGKRVNWNFANEEVMKEAVQILADRTGWYELFSGK